MALFTIDLEEWNDGLHIDGRGISTHEQLKWLFEKLRENNIKAIFYVLGKYAENNPEAIEAIWENGHEIKSHGYYHYRHEDADRRPYANMGMTGGFWFRFLPYSFIKNQVIKTGNFYIHLHDLMDKHPRLNNPIMNFKRSVGLKSVKLKLERLMKEVDWDEPR